MMFPTKGINIHIDFPTGFKLQTYIIGIEPDEYEPKEFESTFFFSHSDWFLPLTGFAFMLKKETVNEGLPVSGKILPDTSSEMITTENT